MNWAGASAAWARADLRSRWRSLVALGLLAGVTAGLVIAALSGASRTDSALDRLRDREDAADAIVFSSQVGADHPDWSVLGAEPEVDRVAPWALVFGAFGEGGPEATPPGPGLLFASVDGTFFGEVGRPIVTEGRMYDPEAPDEIVIDERAEGVDVGDVIPFTAPGVGETAEVETGGPPTGPRVDFRVVGRVRTIGQFLFVTDGQAVVSPGFIQQHGEAMDYFENADVRLAQGAADVPALTRHVDELIAPGVPLLDLHASARRVSTTTSVERSALILLGAAMALAGLVLVGQPLARSAAVVVDDLRTLTAMGMTRAGIIAAAVLAHILSILVAVVAALTTAVVASWWFPVGLAGEIDPDRGLHVSPSILVPGIALVAVLLLAGLVLVVLAAIRRERSARVPRAGLVASLRRVTPVAVGLGTSMAFEPGAGRDRVPVRPALVGAMVGILGIAAAMTVNLGLDDALDNPERAGVAWDATVLPSYDVYEPRNVTAEFATAVGETEGVAEAAVIDRHVVDVGGVGTPTFAIRPLPGEAESGIDLVVTEGRAPERPTEVAVGPDTADQIGAGVGDTITIGEEGNEVTIVGEAFFPADVHARFDEGAWLSVEAFEEVVPPTNAEDFTGAARLMAVRFDQDVHVEAGVAALGESVGDSADEIGQTEVPVELANLTNVRTLPNVLAVFLALLAVAALGHVLATSARRRRREFAILRSLGVSRRGTRLILNSQGTTIGLVGLLIGIPVGVAVGRAGWSLVAGSVPLVEIPPGVPPALLVIVPVALLVANALAVWPGQRISRLRAGEVLRTE